MRNFYDRCNYQNRYRSNSGDERIQFSSRIQYGQNYRCRPRYEQSYRNDFRIENFRGNVRIYQNQNFRIQNNRGDTEEIIGMKVHIQVTTEGMTEVVVVVGQGQNQE